jgi:hypothetical protein
MHSVSSGRLNATDFRRMAVNRLPALAARSVAESEKTRRLVDHCSWRFF